MGFLLINRRQSWLKSEATYVLWFMRLAPVVPSAPGVRLKWQATQFLCPVF